jgi:DNA-directed RNA polymerase subunit RPC12/RpoP
MTAMKVDRNSSNGKNELTEAYKEFKLRYICHQCRREFELPIAETVESGRGIKCPECGSTDVQIIKSPSCNVATSGESKMLTWDYVCHQCRDLFELPVPRGPKEEKEAKCPGCSSMDIQRINIGHSEVCPPGG